jgi:hypothetical protein
MISSRTVLLSALLGSLIFNVGCAKIWHELQPHRMNRLNRGPAPSLDPEFTYKSRDQNSRLARRDDATLSVNSTEIVIVRSQSPDATAY